MEISTPEEVGMSSERLRRIDPVMQGYVDRKELAGIVTLVARRSHVVHLEKFGYQDIEAKKPMQLDTIFRIYSMTKPITSVALMMLFEQGLVRLTDPVTRFLLEFKKVKVWANEGELADPTGEITIHDLLRHTAGFSYGGYEETHHPVDKLYDDADLFNRDITLQEMVRRIADLPLVYQPGQAWRYSVATDVVGRVIEVISGLSLADFFAERILQPLGMVDTAFHVPPEKVSRLATLYGPTEACPELAECAPAGIHSARRDSALGVLEEPAASEYLPPVTLHSGGGGLVSTVGDYLRFAQCLLDKGHLDGVRLLGRKTVELMTMNHVPLAALPIRYNGIVAKPVQGFGFGLGFSVLMDVAQAGVMGSVGDCGWGGYADTYFWVSPQEQLIGILMTQYMPSLTYPMRNDFRTLVYQALIG